MDLEPSWFFCCWLGLILAAASALVYTWRSLPGSGREMTALEHFKSRVVPFTPENVFFGRAQEWPPQMFSLFFQKFCILCDKNYSEDVVTGIPTDVKLLCRM
jgi:hypothetical protein